VKGREKIFASRNYEWVLEAALAPGIKWVVTREATAQRQEAKESMGRKVYRPIFKGGLRSSLRPDQILKGVVGQLL